jgi:hypothetical protein
MDLSKLAGDAKKRFEERGGVARLKKDAAELKEIATGKGSVEEKAKAAAQALKDPGAAGEETTPTQTP